MSQPKISKLETGTVTASTSDIEKIADALEVSKKVRAELLDQVDVLATEFNSWRMLLRNGRAHKQHEHANLDESTLLLRVFQPAVVPGWLQTAAYAKGVLGTHPINGTPDSVGDAVTARLERQSVLYEEDKRFSFVITEALLRWPVESAKTMLGQIDRIQSVMTLPNVSVGIIPTLAVVPVMPLNGFVIFDERVVQVETFTAEVVVSEPRDITTYVDLHQRLTAAAVHGEEASALLTSIAASYRRGIRK